jgi:SAM-dependent methyltransferase
MTRSRMLALAIGVALLIASVLLPAQQSTTTQQARDRWNKEFSGPLANLNRLPNAGLVSAVQGRKPGRALDLGTGEGRNALYLVENGWTVTGVDLSEVAIEQARKNASQRGLKFEAVVGDLDVYDFGTERYDLVLSFYMHSWHDRSPTDVPRRIHEALKPGGLLVMEAFAKPEVTYGFSVDELARAFSRFSILRNESVNEPADWDKGNNRHIVRFVGQKK